MSRGPLTPQYYQPSVVEFVPPSFFEDVVNMAYPTSSTTASSPLAAASGRPLPASPGHETSTILQTWAEDEEEVKKDEDAEEDEDEEEEDNEEDSLTVAFGVVVGGVDNFSPA